MDILRDFEEAALSLANVTSCTHLDFAVRKHSPAPRRKILFIAALHGNETGGIGVHLSLIKKIIANPKAYDDFEITFAIGNPDAVIAQKRFINRDINRSFGSDRTDLPEFKRAKVIEELIKQADEVVDLHQTVQPAVTPFMMTPYYLPSLLVMQRLETNLPVISYNDSFSADGMTADHFAMKKAKVAAFTIEMGQFGLHEDQITMMTKILETMFTLDNKTELTKEFVARMHTWDQTVVREGNSELVPGLINFTKTKKDQPLAMKDGQPILSKGEGFILFPKYGELAKTSAELLRTVRPLDPAELQAWMKN